MKIKVSEASGPVLDWMVARALGKRPSMFIFQSTGRLAKEHNYSTDWAQGGPIIERMIAEQGLTLGKPYGADKQGVIAHIATTLKVSWGPTALIAAMRCRVVSKLGDEVEVPDELV